MKLYLSSYGVGNNPERLQQLIGPNKHAAVICNAQDSKSKEKRDERTKVAIQEMTGLGFTAEELDLRDYFDNSQKLEEDILKFGLVWIRGGNVFNLRRAAKYSAFDEIIKSLVKDNKIVYAGFSAGPCLVTPTLHGVEHCDPVDDIPEGYSREIIWDGLGLVDKSIAPHYKSDHYESEAIDQVIQYFKEHNMEYWAISDGQAIVIDGDKIDIIG